MLSIWASLKFCRLVKGKVLSMVYIDMTVEVQSLELCARFGSCSYHSSIKETFQSFSVLLPWKAEFKKKSNSFKKSQEDQLTESFL